MISHIPLAYFKSFLPLPSLLLNLLKALHPCTPWLQLIQTPLCIPNTYQLLIRVYAIQRRNIDLLLVELLQRKSRYLLQKGKPRVVQKLNSLFLFSNSYCFICGARDQGIVAPNIFVCVFDVLDAEDCSCVSNKGLDYLAFGIWLPEFYGSVDATSDNVFL